MKRQDSTKLPSFVVGAIATASASVAGGATVQITFANNVVSSVTGDRNFTADLTGDKVDEDIVAVYGRGKSSALGRVSGGWGAAGGFWGPALGSLALHAFAGWYYTRRFERVGGRASVRAVSAITFTDIRINGGEATVGLLDLTGHVTVGGEAYVQIHRLIFDDASTSAPTGLGSSSTGIPEWVAVPEPSSLALLALGAGGLVTRRRRERSAA
jgi:hypothetical protein